MFAHSFLSLRLKKVSAQAAYFYMTPGNSRDLYDAVASGLRTAYVDSSLDELVRNYPDIGDAYTHLFINDREVIKLLETYGAKFSG